ncbi:MAG: SUMF1/EgtB/PvdO family nonheme iron enzyme [Deltaproteobacteria bacterium]|nr:SUMF1/EgtB/PvdO family nonheme iron enzyme [Deltaproteobacteria bacterium]
MLATLPALGVALALAVPPPPAQLAAFASLPPDPPPADIVRGLHYWVSNEERPELFKPELEALGPGGVLVGVGTDQNFLYAGWMKPAALVLLDFDGAIPALHKAYRAVFLRAATIAEFNLLWSFKQRKQLAAAVDEDVPAGPERDEVQAALGEARAIVNAHNKRFAAGFRERKVPTFLTDEAQYQTVRALFLEGRVFMLRGDLTADRAMQAIARATTDAGLVVRALYLSNAEQYFGYDEGYRKNILALPVDEKSIALRTLSRGRFGLAKDGGQYHYGVQSMLSFKSWVADARTRGVNDILEAAPRKAGYSKMTSPPGAQVAPIPLAIEQAPAVLPCPATAPPETSCVPGGPFLRGTNDSDKNARPQSSVFVQSFLIDRYEVTFADYQACVAEGRCDKAGPNYVDFNAPKQPITGVSWFHAKKFCEAHGKRLPTEAEWEKAARGTDGRRYPWGEESATCARAVIMTEAGRSCGVKQRSKNHPDTGRPEPVGSKPATQFGLFDMAGNSWEWVADWYSPSWAACGAACAGVDPKGPCGGVDPCPGHDERVVRGGSWYWPAKYATTYHRRAHAPSNRPVFHHFGFRCAASLTTVAR